MFDALEQLLEAPDVEPEAVNLSSDEARTLGNRLATQINASESAKQQIYTRWNQITDAFNCDPRSSGMQIVDGMDPYIFPLYRQKATAIQNSVNQAYFSIKPWAQLIGAEADSESVKPIEDTLQKWLEKSPLKNQAKSAFLDMVHFNCGIIRACIGVSGALEVDHIHPKNACFYPPQTNDYRKLKTLGHKFFLMRWEIREKIAAGDYLEVNVDNLGMTQKETTRDQISVQNPVVDNSDDSIELWQIITKLKLKSDDVHVRYLITIDRISEQILKIEKYPYLRPWYFVVKSSDYEDSMFPSDSVGNVLKNIQLAYNDGSTILFQGSLIGAFPPTFITGGTVGNKVTSYKAGQLIETSEDIKVQSITTQFQPLAIPSVMQKFEEIADGVSGISRLGTSQNLPASTSATAASGFLSAQSEAKDSYVEAVEPTMKELFEFVLELLASHRALVETYLAGQYTIESPFDPMSIEVQPTGGGATTDPRLLAQKLVMLQEMAQNPNSTLDPVKVEEKVIETLDLPFSTETLKKDLGEINGQTGMDTFPGIEAMAGGNENLVNPAGIPAQDLANQIPIEQFGF